LILTIIFLNFAVYMDNRLFFEDAIGLLARLIATPSVSRDETAAADIIESYMRDCRLSPKREKNNVWAVCDNFRDDRPTLLLNAHIDTVKPVASWTKDPFHPEIIDGKLYGLGSNDCGGGLVTLLQVYRMLKDHDDLSYNLIYLASAEEEVSGKDGISRVLPLLPRIDVAIVGEPTGMQPAVAEKGLMVLDVVSHGKSGHAARNEGVNALYGMIDDLCWIRDYRFPKVSDLLGPVKMTATVIHAGTQHNVIPDRCEVTVDVRVNELYTNEEVFEIVKSHLNSDVHAHSFRLNSSHIDMDHPIVKKCVSMGMTPFGSPTLSDQALMSFQSLKLGPGQSARSHSADEYIELVEMQQALEQYLEIISDM